MYRFKTSENKVFKFGLDAISFDFQKKKYYRNLVISRSVERFSSWGFVLKTIRILEYLLQLGTYIIINCSVYENHHWLFIASLLGSDWQRVISNLLQITEAHIIYTMYLYIVF